MNSMLTPQLHPHWLLQQYASLVRIIVIRGSRDSHVIHICFCVYIHPRRSQKLWVRHNNCCTSYDSNYCACLDNERTAQHYDVLRRVVRLPTCLAVCETVSPAAAEALLSMPAPGIIGPGDSFSPRPLFTSAATASDCAI